MLNQSTNENRRSNRNLRTARSGSYAALLGVALVFFVLIGWGIYHLLSRSADNEFERPMTSVVSKGEFVSQVIDQGEIQSAENIEIRCAVQSRNGAIEVIDVVKEGTIVHGGDFLVKLDATSFEKEMEQQRLQMATAETAVVQADASLKAATATLEEYNKGVFVEQQRQINNEIFDAVQERDQAIANLEHNQRLHARGFINSTQLKAFEIAVQKANNSYELAKQKLWVLENITRTKETTTLEGDIKAAEIKLRNEEESFRIEKEKLAEIEEQIDNCEIVVPEGVQGEVVYNKEFDRRGGSEWVLEPGAEVRERQVLIKLPDRSKMEVKALINEQSITLIEPGMPCTIKVDALNNTTLKGVVTRVNQYAESQGWMSSTIREYAAFVRIIDPPANLIPGMNASVTIETQYETDALMVPIQSIYSSGDKQYVLLENSDGSYTTQEVEVGGDNTQAVWVKKGIEDGQRVALNPGAFKELMKLPEVRIENRIEIPDEARQLAKTIADSESSESNNAQDGSGRPGQRGDRQRGDGQRGDGQQREGRRGGGFGNMSVDDMVKYTLGEYDSNGDEKLDADEINAIDERMRGFIKRADGNDDGEITKEELTESTKAMKKRMQQGGGFGGGGE